MLYPAGHGDQHIHQQIVMLLTVSAVANLGRGVKGGSCPSKNF